MQIEPRTAFNLSSRTGRFWRTGKVRLAVFGGLAMLALIGLGSLATTAFHLSQQLYAQAGEFGFNALRQDIRLRTALTSALTNKFSGPAFRRPLPELTFDIKFTNMQKLLQKRAEALETKLLVQRDDDFVPATIRHAEGTLRARIRLKGDQTDHLQGQKWSLRVRLRDDGQLFGMRRFSLQNPLTRGFHGEILFFETLKLFDVLTPKYRFVNVIVNGDDIGIMAMEEHFSKEMLERNGRKESVIIRFDESLVWAANDGSYHGFQGVFDDYLHAPIDAFQSSRIRESEVLSRDLATATGLLRGFLERKLPASEVFDVDRLAAFLAVVDFWGAWHAVEWVNLRFYFNPLSARLEPIGFDGSLHVRRILPPEAATTTSPISRHMLEDARIAAAYAEKFRELADGLREGSLIAQLGEIEQSSLEILRTEFFLLAGFDFSQLDRWVTETPGVHPARYPTFLTALDVIGGDGQSYLELSSAVPHDVDVRSIQRSDGSAVNFDSGIPVSFPLRLSKTVPGVAADIYRIGYVRLASSAGDTSILVTASVAGEDATVTTMATRSYPALDRNPIPSSTLRSQLELHPFLVRAESGKVVHVRSGRWQVSSPIVIPPGYTLRIPAGTQLQFAQDQSMIVHGAVRFEGTADSPIILEGISDGASSESTWQGLAVFNAADVSLLSHVKIRNTSGVHTNGWSLTGGVTFYYSDVKMQHCTIEGSRAEDALNIIHSRFELVDSTIKNTFSDGFDADFSDGSVTGGLFAEIGIGGGDGLDVSGSSVVVQDTTFTDISDKALSVGEGSELTARNVTIRNSGIGAASKDLGKLTISDSTITGSRYAALMAYIKKPEYGPAEILAQNLSIEGFAPIAIVQIGSRIRLNGELIPEQSVDVENLYQTVMKKGVSP